MKILKAILLSISLLFVAAACNRYQTTTSQNSVVNNGCSQLSQTEVISLLPQGADQYDLTTNGYSGDNCFYAFTALMKKDLVASPAIAGTWLINTSSKTAKQIAPMGTYDYVFKDWSSNTQLELHSDNNDTVAVYDITSQSILSRKIVNVIFRFKVKTDVAAVAKALKSQSDAYCNQTQNTIQGFLFYPFSCIQQTDVQIAVPTHGTYSIKYVNPKAISVNGKIYNLSDDKYVEIDL